MDLIKRLRITPNAFDCHDAALALEQAITLFQRAGNDKVDAILRDDIYQWLNTWDKNEDE